MLQFNLYFFYKGSEKMIKEVIVVEGKDDISAVKKAVDAEVIATNGYGFPRGVVERIKKAHMERGIIVLTDPDYAGERIRDKITKLVGNCKHAFISKEAGTKADNIGVENASPESIIEALKMARYEEVAKRCEFTQSDMLQHDLLGMTNSSFRRDFLGKKLGIGYCNAKQFLNRLNNYGIEREEFEIALKELDSSNG